jgi:hypothetical protein
MTNFVRAVPKVPSTGDFAMNILYKIHRFVGVAPVCVALVFGSLCLPAVAADVAKSPSPQPAPAVDMVAVTPEAPAVNSRAQRHSPAPLVSQNIIFPPKPLPLNWHNPRLLESIEQIA